MTKAEAYLYKKLDIMLEEKVEYINKINKIVIEIEEVDTMMEDISKKLDTAYEMFSPRAKKNDFNKDEIERLRTRKEELVLIRDEYVKKCNIIEKDIVEIKEALGENYEDDEIYDLEYEEDLENIKEDNAIYGEADTIIISALNNVIYKCDMCVKIMDVDTVRAKLEIETVIQNLLDMKDNLNKLIEELKNKQDD